MKRYLFLITLLTALTGRIIAQSVTVDATIDSLQILIGEQAKIKLQVSLDTDKRAILPAYTDEISIVCQPTIALLIMTSSLQRAIINVVNLKSSTLITLVA